MDYPMIANMKIIINSRVPRDPIDGAETSKV
jgi:hypothetical protein